MDGLSMFLLAFSLARSSYLSLNQKYIDWGNGGLSQQGKGNQNRGQFQISLQRAIIYYLFLTFHVFFKECVGDLLSIPMCQDKECQVTFI